MGCLGDKAIYGLKMAGLMTRSTVDGCEERSPGGAGLEMMKEEGLLVLGEEQGGKLEG